MQVPLKKLFTGLSVTGAVLGLSQLLLTTHYNRELGIPDGVFTFGDDLVLTVLGQLAFVSAAASNSGPLGFWCCPAALLAAPLPLTEMSGDRDSARARGLP